MVQYCNYNNLNIITHVQTHICTYTQTHTNKSHNNICIFIHTPCTCTTSCLLVGQVCLWRFDSKMPQPKGIAWHKTQWKPLRRSMKAQWRNVILDGMWFPMNNQNPLALPPSPIPRRFIPPSTNYSFYCLKTSQRLLGILNFVALVSLIKTLIKNDNFNLFFTVGCFSLRRISPFVNI